MNKTTMSAAAMVSGAQQLNQRREKNGKNIYHFILIKFVRNPVQILRNKISTAI